MVEVEVVVVVEVEVVVEVVVVAAVVVIVGGCCVLCVVFAIRCFLDSNKKQNKNDDGVYLDWDEVLNFYNLEQVFTDLID